MLNIVSDRDGYPSTVPIRALAPIGSVDQNYSSILQNTEIDRRRTKKNYSLIRANKRIVQKPDGPGKLTKVLKIDKRFNDKLANKKTRLWIENHDKKISARKIRKTPRIGIGYAEEWIHTPLRFIVKDSWRKKRKP